MFYHVVLQYDSLYNLVFLFWHSCTFVAFVNYFNVLKLSLIFIDAIISSLSI